MIQIANQEKKMRRREDVTSKEGANVQEGELEMATHAGKKIFTLSNHLHQSQLPPTMSIFYRQSLVPRPAGSHEYLKQKLSRPG